MNNLLRLLQLSDPALPIGGFSHSAGLETYVLKGIVKDRSTATNFIINQLSQNIHFTDAAFVSLAYDAAKADDVEALIDFDIECNAVKLPSEMRMASKKMGSRLVKIFGSLCGNPITKEIENAITKNQISGHYAIMFGVYGQAMGILKKELLSGFYYNSAAAMVTNSVKLIPLGQQDGQEILFSVHGLIEELVIKSINPDREMIGYCCAGFDIRCMEHERLYSRLYMHECSIFNVQFSMLN